MQLLFAAGVGAVVMLLVSVVVRYRYWSRLRFWAAQPMEMDSMSEAWLRDHVYRTGATRSFD